MNSARRWTTTIPCEECRGQGYLKSRHHISACSTCHGVGQTDICLRCGANLRPSRTGLTCGCNSQTRPPELLLQVA